VFLVFWKHILECILFRWLGERLPSFPSQYVQSDGWSQLRVEVIGRPVWLREASFGSLQENDSTDIRPVHYDVVTLTRVWTMKPGNRNLWDSIVCFLQMGVKHRHDLLWNNPELLKVCQQGQISV